MEAVLGGTLQRGVEAVLTVDTCVAEGEAGLNLDGLRAVESYSGTGCVRHNHRAGNGLGVVVCLVLASVGDVVLARSGHFDDVASDENGVVEVPVELILAIRAIVRVSGSVRRFDIVDGTAAVAAVGASEREDGDITHNSNGTLDGVIVAGLVRNGVHLDVRVGRQVAPLHIVAISVGVFEGDDTLVSIGEVLGRADHRVAFGITVVGDGEAEAGER